MKIQRIIGALTVLCGCICLASAALALFYASICAYWPMALQFLAFGITLAGFGVGVRWLKEKRGNEDGET